MFDRTLKWITRSLFENTKGYMCQNCPCGAGIRTSVFDTNGDIYACDLFYGDRNFYLGNIFEAPVKEIYREDHAVLHNLLSRDINKIDECRKCEWKHVCSGDCTAKAYYHYNSLNEPSPYCRFFKEIIPYLYSYIKSNAIDYTIFSGFYSKDLL